MFSDYKNKVTNNELYQALWTWAWQFTFNALSTQTSFQYIISRNGRTPGVAGPLLVLCWIIPQVKSKLFKGNIHPISPARNRVTFQIVAYLLTIDLLYALDAYHIDSVNTCYD